MNKLYKINYTSKLFNLKVILKKQIEYFREKLGDDYFDRMLKNSSFEKRIGQDYLISFIQDIVNFHKENNSNAYKKITFLEFGCGAGWRTAEIKNKFNFNCYGVDPSKKAISHAKKNYPNVNFSTGSVTKVSSKLYGKIDIVFFGFCLFLVDQIDLFEVASITNKLLKPNGHIILMDFDTKNTYKKQFYKTNLFSHKMNFSSLFLWHPFYSICKFTSFTHKSNNITNDQDEKIGMYLINKYVRD